MFTQSMKLLSFKLYPAGKSRGVHTVQAVFYPGYTREDVQRYASGICAERYLSYRYEDGGWIDVTVKEKPNDR